VVQLSLFLFLKQPDTEIQTIASEDIQEARQSWKERSRDHPRASGLTFAGYHPPLLGNIEKMLGIFEGVMLVAENARWLLPDAYTNTSQKVGRIPASVHYPEMPVYEGGTAWGGSTRTMSILRGLNVERWRQRETLSQEEYLEKLPTIDAQDPAQIAQIAPVWALDVPIEHLVLSTGCLNALRWLEMQTISRIQNLPSDQRRSRHLGKVRRLELAKELLKLLADGPDRYCFIGKSGHVTALLECIQEALQALPEPDQHIFRARLALDGKQATLNELAQKHGLTNEGVRQAEARALLNMPRAQRLGQLMRQRLTALLSDRSEPLYLDRLEEEDAWFRGLSQMPATFEILLRHFAKEIFYLWEYQNRLVIARISWQSFCQLKEEMTQAEMAALAHDDSDGLATVKLAASVCAAA